MVPSYSYWAKIRIIQEPFKDQIYCFNEFVANFTSRYILEIYPEISLILHCIYASATWTIFGSDNGLSPVRCQAIIWSNVAYCQLDPQETLIEIQTFSFKKMHLKMSSGKQWWGGWGCEVSCGGHHRPRGKTTTGSALDGAVFDIAQILAYLVHNMSRSQLYLGFGHFGWLPSFFGQ